MEKINTDYKRRIWKIKAKLVNVRKPWLSSFKLSQINGPFPSCRLPLFQNESKCETIQMKMSLIYVKMNMRVKLIFIWLVSHLDSSWKRGTSQLGNGLLKQKFRSYGSVLPVRDKMSISNGKIRNCDGIAIRLLRVNFFKTSDGVMSASESDVSSGCHFNNCQWL